MQNNYPSYPPSYGQQQSVKSQHSINTHMSSSTHLSRRTMSRPPPRFRPIMILIFVISTGIALVGLIMTIIAVWPGYTPVGGNPLKIVGPTLLGIGGFVFILAMINVCWFSNKTEKHQLARQQLIMAQAHARSTQSMATTDHSMVSTPTKRPKSILKNPSTSTYNGEVRTSDMEGSFNRSDELVSDTSTGSANPDNVRISMDPTGAHQRSYGNRGYSPDARETDIDGDIANGHAPGQRSMQQYANKGFDMYDPSLVGQGALAGLVGHSDMGLTPPRTITPRQPPPQARREREMVAASASPYQQDTSGSRWGQSRRGVANTSYEEDPPVATVSKTYNQATTPSRGQVPQQYTPRSSQQPAVTASPVSPSVSTDV